MNDGKKVFDDALFWADKKGRITLGRGCYSYPDPEDNSVLILRSSRALEASLRLKAGDAIQIGDRETNTYNLAKTVLLPEGAEIPEMPKPYGGDLKFQYSDGSGTGWDLHNGNKDVFDIHDNLFEP